MYVPKLRMLTRTMLVPYERFRRALDVAAGDLHISFYIPVKRLEIDKKEIRTMLWFFSLMFFVHNEWCLLDGVKWRTLLLPWMIGWCVRSFSGIVKLIYFYKQDDHKVISPLTSQDIITCFYFSIQESYTLCNCISVYCWNTVHSGQASTATRIKVQKRSFYHYKRPSSHIPGLCD